MAIAWFAALLALNYAVPYTALRDCPKVAGAYLFWTLLTLVAAASCFVLVRRWRGGG